MWRMSFTIAAGLVVYAGTLVLVAISFLATASPEYFQDKSHLVVDNPPLAFAADALRSFCVAILAMALLAYAFLSSKAPRPSEFHAHGAVFILMPAEYVLILLNDILDRQRQHVAAWVLMIVTMLIYSARKTLFFMLMVHKVMVLGPRANRLQDIRFWGYAIIIITAIFTLAGSTGIAFFLIVHARGVSPEELYEALDTSSPSNGSLSDSEMLALNSLIFLGVICATMLFMSSFAFMCVANHARNAAIATLAASDTPGEVLEQARRILRKQILGVVMTVTTNQLVILAGMTDGINLLGSESAEDAGMAFADVVDVVGDIAAVFLLSGMSVLLFKEDPEAGGIGRHICSLLHSTVLTSRVDLAFEGRVLPNPRNFCIVSFPGRHLLEWNAMTAFCRDGEVSSACVFLPKGDPRERFGQHGACEETPEKCWCHHLYGDIKPWGCLWFQLWMANVEKAIALGLDLVVVFYPGQAGQGMVQWGDLGTADLWDGVGLGASQKAEVAYLQKRGVDFTREDLEATKRRIMSAPIGNAVHSPRHHLSDDHRHQLMLL